MLCVVEQIKIKSSMDVTEIEHALCNAKEDIEGILSDWIMKHYEEKIIDTFIQNKFDDLSAFERDDIRRRVVRSIDESERSLCKEMIRIKLKEYLSTLKTVNIDGFVTFRLQDYKEELEFIVEECGYEYIALKDYADIVDILKYFSEIADEEDYDDGLDDD